MDTPNEARYQCKSCDGRIIAPGVGHAVGCRALADGVEYLQYTPPPYVVRDGKYYLSLQGGYAMTRRITQVAPLAT